MDMKIGSYSPVKSQAKEQRKAFAARTAANAMGSAVLSIGLTAVLNKGQTNPKDLARFGGLVAGISVALDVIREMIHKSKANSKCEMKMEKLQTHQG